MQEEDGLITGLRTMLAAELAEDPEPRAGSAVAIRVERLRATLATAEEAERKAAAAESERAAAVAQAKEARAETVAMQSERDAAQRSLRSFPLWGWRRTCARRPISAGRG